MTEVLVPARRFVRWVDNFGGRHGDPALEVGDGALRGTAAEG
jgi:hypothetical protein